MIKDILKVLIAACLVNMLVYGASSAGIIKSWSAGDTLTTADVNANFQHIHNSMVGGHGARLKDADVSATANISATKIAGKLIPRAWALIASGCSAGACTLTESSGITSAAASSTTLTVTLNYTATDSDFAVFVTPNTSNFELCSAQPATTTTLTIKCQQHVDLTDCVTAAGVNCDHTFLTTFPKLSIVVYDID